MSVPGAQFRIILFRQRENQHHDNFLRQDSDCYEMGIFLKVNCRFHYPNKVKSWRDGKRAS